MHHFLLSVLAGLLPASTPEAKTLVPATPVAEVKFNDGSLVKVTMQQPALTVKTKYGTLTIPFEDIRHINIGRHVSEEMQKQINEAMGLLSSQAYKEREDAMYQLTKAGPVAYSFLKKASKHANLEVANRVNQLLKKLADLHLPEELSRREEDIIQTTEFPVIGRIENLSIKAHSENFGELALRLPALRTIHLRTSGGPAELTVDATKYGSAPDQWLDTDLTVDPNTRLHIKSDGKVDLWPQGPGQYMTGPKGYTTIGRGSIYMAGALLGRIGKSGKVFVIGDHYDAIPTEAGELYVHIVPNLWNNASAGYYKLRITTTFASSR